jgi:hypothetical protein
MPPSRCINWWRLCCSKWGIKRWSLIGSYRKDNAQDQCFSTSGRRTHAGTREKSWGAHERNWNVWIFVFVSTMERYITDCGVFTPCKNCNIEIRSRDYATVDEAVFPPCRAELCRTVTSRASPRLSRCQAKALNTWTTQEWGGATWPRDHVSSDVTRFNSDATIEAPLEGARSRVILGGRQPWKVRGWRRSERVIRSDRFQLSEGVQSSRLRVRVISEVKWSEEE